MKKISLLFAIILLAVTTLSAQCFAPEGTWSGVLQLPTGCLKLVFHLQKEGVAWKASLDSPDQGAYGISIDQVTINGDEVAFSSSALQLSYRGTCQTEELIDGTFQQGGYTIALQLKKGTIPSALKTEQPQTPPPYLEKELTVQQHPQGIKLVGTLTIPEKCIHPTSAIILLSGSGPQNRDEELFGHKPFAILADSLARNGYIVFRYDDRGVGKSSGNFSTASMEDLITDARSVLSLVQNQPEVAPHKIILLGHSEGGYIAARIAKEHPEVAAVISLASPTVPFRQCITEQAEAVSKQMGITKEQYEQNRRFNDQVFDWAQDTTLSMEELYEKVTNYTHAYLQEVKELTEEQRGQTEENIRQQICSEWFRQFIRVDPGETWSQLSCPVIAIFGSKDKQVFPNNAERLHELLPQARIRLFEGLNHLMQSAQSGFPNEYASLPSCMDAEMIQWLLQELASLDSKK